MDATVEMECDMIFSDLSKQIFLLITDDEEEHVTNYPPVPIQAYSKEVYPSVQSLYFYEQAWGREIKGTGVFIPKSSQLTKGRNNKGRFSFSKSKYYKQPDNTGGLSWIYNNCYANPNIFQE